MQEVGEAMHIAKSGRLIIRLSANVKPGDLIVDSKGRQVAKVIELIGPVRAPYASALPMTERIKKYEGSRLYSIGKITRRKR